MNTTGVDEPGRAAPTAGAAGVTPGRLRAWTARHPLPAFLVLALGGGWPLVSVVALADRGVLPGGRLVAALPIAPDELAGLLLTWGALVPATLYVTWAVDGRAGVGELGARLRRWRVGAGWWLLAVAGMPVAALGIALLLGDGLTPVSPIPFVATQAGLLAVNLVLVNLWEEAAWSGLVQTRLQRRHGVLVAALLTAVPFALAHWPLVLFTGVTAGSAVTGLIGYLVLGGIFRPMLAMLMRGAAGSVLLVAVLHSSFNRTNNANGIAAGLLRGDAGQLPMVLAAVVVAIVAALAGRGRRPQDG